VHYAVAIWRRQFRSLDLSRPARQQEGQLLYCAAAAAAAALLRLLLLLLPLPLTPLLLLVKGCCCWCGEVGCPCSFLPTPGRLLAGRRVVRDAVRPDVYGAELPADALPAARGAAGFGILAV
jgi:hypothetical protein